MNKFSWIGHLISIISFGPIMSIIFCGDQRGFCLSASSEMLWENFSENNIFLICCDQYLQLCACSMFNGLRIAFYLKNLTSQDGTHIILQAAEPISEFWSSPCMVLWAEAMTHISDQLRVSRYSASAWPPSNSKSGIYGSAGFVIKLWGASSWNKAAS